MKRILTVLGLLIFFGLGVFLTRYYYQVTEAEKVEEQAEVLLERIQTVAKMVTVEGYFSEIYNYKEYWRFDWSIFRKKALIRVKAKVSVGYDLSNMKIEAQEKDKLILISNIPDPEIISIDHDLDYYDLSQGTFNSFTEEDYNKLNSNAKLFIEEKAKESDLFEKAEEQGNQLIELIQFITESTGWQVQVEGKIYPPLIQQDSLLN